MNPMQALEGWMIYRFGLCELNTESCVLTVDGQLTPLRPKALDLLTYLLAHHHRMISKDELFEQVWSGRYVSDSTLESTMRTVRQTIGDSGRHQQMIETRYGQGYRFVAAVSAQADEEQAAVDGVEIATRVALPASVHDTDRNVIALVCCHLTLASADYGVHTLHERLQELCEIIEQAIKPYQGTVQHIADNRILIAFGSSKPQENHVLQTVLSALERPNRQGGRQA